MGGERVSRTTHPAFGLVSVTRQTSNVGTRLFGSALTHRTMIHVSIKTATSDRTLGRDWHHEGTHVCGFTMSEAQWATFISAMGNSGTPCTFDLLPESPQLKIVPGIDVTDNMTDKHTEDLRRQCAKYMEKVQALHDQVQELATVGKANKTQLREIAHALSVIADNLPGDMAFSQKSFATAMETVVTSGKMEIEAFVHDLAVRTGITAIANAPTMVAITDE